MVSKHSILSRIVPSARVRWPSTSTATSVACLVVAATACNAPPAPPIEPMEEPTPVELRPTAEDAAAFAALRGRLDEIAGMTAGDLIAAHPTEHGTLGYAPGEADHLASIQDSSFALDSAEMAQLEAQGFVISHRLRHPSFAHGYSTIYMEDLPLYISVDSILEGIHRSYDQQLAQAEEALLVIVEELIQGMRARLASGIGHELGESFVHDADVYLTVAERLLTGNTAAPLNSATVESVAFLVAQAEGAEGSAPISLFGAGREVDFSQFAPRGHYLDTPELERYFRAMMWLGRIDLRIIETQPGHTQLFHRRQLALALGLTELMGDEGLARWESVDEVLRTFVGEPDYMLPADVGAFRTDLGIAALSDLTTRSDEVLAQGVIDGGYGAQRVSSHFMVNGLEQGTMPLSRSFAVFGQRYTPDAHVFSNVVYDRVRHSEPERRRMMPDPLDVAYAALGNDEALPLLEEDLNTHEYAPHLESMRLLLDEHGQDFGAPSLYTVWLGALRMLSPTAEGRAALPSVARTEPWGRRMLNTQLASWAELRHDTLLYAKQSYTTGAACEFPDAYVDPYPAFFAALERYAEFGLALTTRLPGDTTEARAHWEEVRTVVGTLRVMAEQELRGEPFTAAQMAFVNDAVTISGCTFDDTATDGWYARLFLPSRSYPHDITAAARQDPVVADVHTQPTDAYGNEVGRVLHVGTGLPRAMVVTVDTCTGPRAYVGLVSSYFEQVTEDWERLNDEVWSTQILTEGHPDEVRWMQGVVSRATP